MIEPKRKISKQRSRTRRANWKISAPGMIECPQCHQQKLAHRVCEHCGYYDGRQVINMEAKKA